MATKIHFTKARLERLPAPIDRDRELYKDDEITSLELAVFKSGKKTFYVYKRIGTKPSRIKLGVFPDLTVDNARREAQGKLGAIAQGTDPSDRNRQLRKELTFDQLFKLFMDKHARIHKKSYWFDQDLYNYHLKSKFGNTKLSDITSDKIRNFHIKLGENGKTGANRVLDLISSILSKAIEWELYRGDNPAKRVKKFRMKSRDRFLQPEEMPRFFEALGNEDNEIARDYIFLSLFTGARKSNVLSMRWDEVNLQASQPFWRIPGAKSKSGEPMQIPLSIQALEILKLRRKNNSTSSKYVFPGRGEKGYLADPKKVWKRVLERAKIKDLRIHDLRRTLGSWLASSGANSFMIGKALGHSSMRSTAIYARLNLDPVAQSVEIATKAMIEAGRRKQNRKK